MKKIFILAVLFLASRSAFTQNISGVINNYAVITAINANIINVSTTNGFNVGDKVMLIKMKGAQINQANTSAYGDTTTMDEAGKYIFTFILAIDNINNTISLSPFCDVFANDNYMQLVSVPIFPNPVITAPLTCPQWDGLTGGILILETPNTLTLNADILTTAKGYRGGDLWGSTFSCGSLNYFSAAAFFGPEGKKGEGVADWIVGQECGKGKLANGGGGAYSGNTGAGGGANAGKGGDGGFEYSGCGANPVVFSVGGMSIDHKNTILLMGGGGGGPQSDNGQQVYNGGNGGTIVFITAANIAGNGFNIKNSGESPPTINDEGAPGGGAGGSVYLNCPAFTGVLNINVDGGAGSSNNNVIFTTDCHGPGGGGGGGLVWFSTAVTPPGVNVSAIGGAAGLVLNPLSACFNTTYNAQAGNTGLTKFNFVPTPLIVPPVINIGPDTTICENSVLVLDAGPGYTTYLWDDATTNQTRSVNAPGTFYVTVTTPNGCTASDTVIVTQDTSVKAIFTAVIHYGCDNDTVFLTNNSQGATQYNWLFGDGGYSTFQNPQPYVYMTQGSFVIRLIAFNGPCADTAYQNITINHSVSADFTINNNTTPPPPVVPDSICIGKVFTATPVPPIDPTWVHAWDWGDGSPIDVSGVVFHQYLQPGTYVLTHIVTDTLGCTDTVRMNLFVDYQTYVRFTVSDSVICLGEPINFYDTMTPNIVTFYWNFKDGQIVNDIHNPIHSWESAGSYDVTLVGVSLFCPPDSFTKTILVNDFPKVNLGKDTSICPGVTGSVFLADINNPTATYVWSTGETTNGITVTQPGHYWVKASNGNCITIDSVWIKRDCYLNIPNVFSPDGDGLNDYFLPRELLSSGIRTFKMSIYNRWGENIFVTTQIDGRGWDGKYNGTPQPLGTYVYVIDVEFVNNIAQTFKGNVTLIR